MSASKFEGATWHKSNLSGDTACVMVAYVDGTIGVRDSKQDDGPILCFNETEWAAFVAAVGNGEFEISRLGR